MPDQSLAKRNIAVLTVAQSLGGAGAPVVVSLGGLVGQSLSPTPALITLPVSLFSLGLAIGVVPAAMLMRALGRRGAYRIGAMLGVVGGLVAAFGISIGSFLVFCLGTMGAGLYASFVQSYRFAATDQAEGDLRGKAISSVMIGGLIAAFIGPQLVILTREAVPGAPFMGSFLSQAAMALLAIPVLSLLRVPPPQERLDGAAGGRGTLALLKSPDYALALAAGVVSYGLMSFVMTAAPVAMVNHGHGVDQATLGIQWHVLAMFAPSFVTGRLIARYGKERLTASGLAMIGIGAIVALSGMAVWQFWVSLVLLGVGWNFGFLGATAMLLDTHTENERAVAQGTNDFFVFSTVAAASFLSGGILQSAGWTMVNLVVFPAIALVLVPLVWKSRTRTGADAQVPDAAEINLTPRPEPNQ
ncbi:MFS transporter [Flavimaricola marinus]|uniref:Major Facilitator Superfamily protein n=1 Tax=Flavimaricola marinus TaxID=1819565 RepID=A0A238LIC6_9RHOB|nr:MFS transporter [Flavimaricola marinus]SMY09439.1 Major Facilitator Superfamily protein [Flavimaricola marinus]